MAKEKDSLAEGELKQDAGSPAPDAAQTGDEKGKAKKEKPPKPEKAAKPAKSVKPAKGAQGAKNSKQPKGKQRKIKLRFTKRSFLLKVVMRIAIFFFSLTRGLKVEKVRMKKIKPPYLLLCNHLSFTDYAVVERVSIPHDVHHICEVSEFVDSESLMNNLGCIPLRRFAADSKLLYHMRETIVQNKIVALYPEAHFSFDGFDSTLPDTLFKMIKQLKVPVVVVKVRGTYISHPCWSKIDHKLPLEATVTQVLSVNEVKACDDEAIKQRIVSAFHYDDSWWQLQNNVRVASPQRAQGLENILYLCPMCGQEYHMRTKGTKIYCESCNQAWQLSDLGNLTPVENSLNTSVLDGIRSQQEAVMQAAQDKKRLEKAKSEFVHLHRQYEMRRSEYDRAMLEREQMIEDAKLFLTPVPVFDAPPLDPGPEPVFTVPPQIKVSMPPPEDPPDISRIPHWYEFQRKKIVEKLQDGNYFMEILVRVEMLSNISQGFIPLGKGVLTHSANGLSLSYQNRYGQRADLVKTPLSTYSCHVDFDYMGKGPFVDMSTAEETFYLYPETDDCSVTKIALATEEIYKMAMAFVNQQKKN